MTQVCWCKCTTCPSSRTQRSPVWLCGSLRTSPSIAKSPMMSIGPEVWTTKVDVLVVDMAWIQLALTLSILMWPTQEYIPSITDNHTEAKSTWYEESNPPQKKKKKLYTDCSQLGDRPFRICFSTCNVHIFVQALWAWRACPKWPFKPSDCSVTWHWARRSVIWLCVTYICLGLSVFM